MKTVYLLVRDELDGDLIPWETHDEYLAFTTKELGEKYIEKHNLKKKDFRIESINVLETEEEE